ncbi:PAS domain-containing protein [Rhodoferax sp.]|uniref:PAS domain-containing protein n=1 Tax=Rhodoferax sp. TaxID=50421 RepID=UPI00271C8F2E|nr:PAS domain-containing protein [Rhodoferax sp.]MDO9143707.1 PAS domain-containing protein [Rhodoferax sp.]MDP2441538.1 PAS domain-containing protein [Rhodoferax sp.]MDP3191177.1 PAS domain-containing protein [Rhodoferax sp.]MDP3336311.1 PAS domain-containing protein [Rhodoferax sp.]MDP3864399.1 PAS domain-containing protein [Rhodoferax sp.]
MTKVTHATPPESGAQAAAARFESEQRFSAINGYPRQSPLGVSFLDITHPDDRARSAEVCERLLSLGEGYGIEKRNVRADCRGLARPTAGPITLSVGVTIAHEEQANENEAVLDADKALYLAKDRGRNQVQWAPKSVVRARTDDAIHAKPVPGTRRRG